MAVSNTESRPDYFDDSLFWDLPEVVIVWDDLKGIYFLYYITINHCRRSSDRL